MHDGGRLCKWLTGRTPFLGLAWSLLLAFTVGCDWILADTLSLNTADQPPYSTPQNDGYYDTILQAVFSRLGLAVTINHLPSARSLENVIAGLDDGEYARIRGLEEDHGKLALVDEELASFEFTAFALDSSFAIRSWRDLAKYNVAYIRGWQMYEQQVDHARSALAVSSTEQLFGLLTKGRVDIALYEKLRGLHYLRQAQIDNVVPLTPPLAVRPMYLYLADRHRALAPIVADELRKFKLSAEFVEIHERFTSR